MASILVIDDDHAVLATIKILLERAPKSVPEKMPEKAPATAAKP